MRGHRGGTMAHLAARMAGHAHAVMKDLHRSGGGADVYLLHTAPGADHHLFRTLEEAVAQAVMLAKLNQVRAWLTTEEGYDFMLVDDFRVTESAWNKR